MGCHQIWKESLQTFCIKYMLCRKQNLLCRAQAGVHLKLWGSHLRHWRGCWPREACHSSQEAAEREAQRQIQNLTPILQVTKTDRSPALIFEGADSDTGCSVQHNPEIYDFIVLMRLAGNAGTTPQVGLCWSISSHVPKSGERFPLGLCSSSQATRSQDPFTVCLY